MRDDLKQDISDAKETITSLTNLDPTEPISPELIQDAEDAISIIDELALHIQKLENEKIDLEDEVSQLENEYENLTEFEGSDIFQSDNIVDQQKVELFLEHIDNFTIADFRYFLDLEHSGLYVNKQDGTF